MHLPAAKNTSRNTLSPTNDTHVKVLSCLIVEGSMLL